MVIGRKQFNVIYSAVVICRLLGNCPNTYTYTKALAEQLLEEQCGTVPLAIVRPSIVTAALKEPVPGWVDNYNGATGKTIDYWHTHASCILKHWPLSFIGTIAAVGKGFFRVMKINADLVADIIPVDYPINLMIAVAWHLATRRYSTIKNIKCDQWLTWEFD